MAARPLLPYGTLFGNSVNHWQQWPVCAYVLTESDKRFRLWTVSGDFRTIWQSVRQVTNFTIVSIFPDTAVPEFNYQVSREVG